MGRTAASGIRISAGKSSKKVGGTASKSSSLGSGSKSRGSSKLPPIPFQETPSWQKPITNFLKANVHFENKESNIETDNVNENLNNLEDVGSSQKKFKVADEEKKDSVNDKDGKKENEAENNLP